MKVYVLSYHCEGFNEGFGEPSGCAIYASTDKTAVAEFLQTKINEDIAEHGLETNSAVIHYAEIMGDTLTVKIDNERFIHYAVSELLLNQ